MAMHSGDDSLQRLRAAIRDLAATDAGDVVAEAREQARARVLAMLSDAMSHSLLESIEERIAVPNPNANDTEQSPATEQTPGTEQVMPSENHREEQIAGEQAWYVYGVVGSLELEPGDELTGVDARQPVTTLHEGSLAAVVSQVPSGEFEDTQLRAHLSDMDWVETLARAHESVLDVTRQQVTVVPMRMCTVYRTEGGVREMLRRESSAFEEALAHLEAKAEWGVKVFADPNAAVVADTESEGSASAGAAYMDSRRRDLERRELAAGRVQEAAVQIHERLCELAVDGLVAPPQRPEASGYSGEMTLNGVYLVEDAAEDAFAEGVSELQDEFAPLGLTLVLTGPWPAYNFVPGAIGAAW